MEHHHHLHGLDILVHDKDFGIRCVVIEQGYRRDGFAKDESLYVKTEITKQDKDFGCQSGHNGGGK